MIVVDASAMVELLLQTDLGARVEVRLFGGSEDLHAPHLIDLEVVQAMRRFTQSGDLDPSRAQQALEDLADIDVHRHAHGDLMERIWALRANFTAYDAAYIALAEALAAPLVTCDRPLASAPGHRARVEAVR